MNKTAKKHFDAIQRDNVTKTNVIGIRKLLNATARQSRGYWTGRTSPKASFADADAILAEVHKTKPIVSGALHDSGLKLLQSKRYAKQLERVASILPEIICFRLIDFQELRRDNFYPVYQATAKSGARFEFYNIPWQSGGTGPEILGVY